MTTVYVDRFDEHAGTTISRWVIDGKFICYGLEDGHNEPKVPGETRIPSGRYQLKLRKEGGFHERYIIRFPKIHKGMIQLMDVPGFTYILIHCGNTKKHTEGCLLTGTAFVKNNDGYVISESAKAYKQFYPFIADKLESGEECWIEISDPHRQNQDTRYS